MQRDRDRIGLFARRTSSSPNAKRFVVWFVYKLLWENGVLEKIKRGAVPKKAGDTDQQVVKEDVQFAIASLQVSYKFFDISDLMNVHATFYSPANRFLFVMRKIAARAVLK